jgi:hypothetical protein
VACFSALFTR